MALNDSTSREIPVEQVETASKLLGALLRRAKSEHATDVIIRADAPLVYRAQAEFQHAVGWDGLAERGIVERRSFLAMLAAASGNSLSPNPSPFTCVVRLDGEKARVQYHPNLTPPQLVVRLQPEHPYPLSDYLPPDKTTGTSATITALHSANGLILVCGGMGAGKTSLLSSIVESWASKPTEKGTRHVMLLADPVEYSFDPTRYVVSTLECALTEAGRRPGRPYITEVMPDVLRSSAGALAVSEIREARALLACLDFAASKEPVIATFHAASISDCIVRALGMLETVTSAATARLLLSTCLEGVFHVRVAFADGKAVPLVEYLPAQQSAIRSLIGRMDGTIDMLASKIDETQATTSNERAAISRPQLNQWARSKGLSEADVCRYMGRLRSPTPSR